MSSPSVRRDYAAAASATKQAQKQQQSQVRQPSSRKMSTEKSPSTAGGHTAGPLPLSADLPKEMGDRLLFLLANLVGTKVQVQVTNGLFYEGIFHAAQSDQDMGVILRMARKLSSKDGVASDRLTADSVIPYLIIQSKDLVQIAAADVEMGFALDRAAGTTDRRGFETDTGISGHSGDVQERNLERWMPETGSDILTLEPETVHKGEWDQFATNEKLFGVTTDFNEEIYTTKLDKNSTEYKRREKEAARLAQQIEQAAVTNVHLAEERGIAVDDSQMDEEDRYGAVVRKPGAYVPPALRKKLESETPAVKPSEPQKVKPESVAAKPTEVAPPTEEKPVTAAETPSKTAKLNPNASSFKFNLSASSFTPNFEPAKPAATPSQNRSPPRRQEFNQPRPTYIFGKALSRGALSIKALLLENFKRSTKNLESPDSSTLSDFWPFGQWSYSEIARGGNGPEMMPSGVMYGYPYPVAYPAPPQPRATFIPPSPVPYMPPPVYPFPGMPPGGMPVPMPVMPGYPGGYPGAYGMPMQPGAPPEMNGRQS